MYRHNSEQYARGRGSHARSSFLTAKKENKRKGGRKKKSAWNNITLNAARSFDPVRVAYLCNVSHLSPKTPLAVAAAP